MTKTASTGPLDDLQRAERTDPDRVLLRWRGGSWTVRRFAAVARAVAAELSASGLGPGDRVAIMSGNSARTLAVTYGVWLAGAVEVAVNTELRGPLLHHVLTDADPALVLASADLLPTARTERPDLAFRAIEDLDLDRQDAVPSGPLPAPADLASLLYTSGTTGPSKGVMIPHGYLAHYAGVLGDVLELTGDDVCYFSLPFFHVDAHIAVPTALRCGSTLAFAERFSVSRFWDDVEHFSATWFGAVGSMLSALATRPAPGPAVLERLRLVLAAPIPEDAYEFFEDGLGVPLLQMYGQTEANGPIYSTLTSRRRGAMGLAHEDFEVRAAAADGSTCPTGEVGALQTRPRREHVLAQGYWRRPEATDQTFDGTWFVTGDLAWQDADGFWWYAGRATDSLRKRGENVSAFEVEAVLRTAPDVREAAIVAVRDELGGEDDIKAVLVADPGFDPATFAAHCRDHLPRFARPRYLELVEPDQLVRGPGTGAIQKHLLPQGLTSTTVDLDAVGAQ